MESDRQAGSFLTLKTTCTSVYLVSQARDLGLYLLWLCECNRQALVINWSKDVPGFMLDSLESIYRPLTFKTHEIKEVTYGQGDQ